MRDVAVVGFAQSPSVRRETSGNEVEMLMPILLEAKRQAGLTGRDIGITVSGSCDYLAGQPFAFVSALDAVGAWPPIVESHVEMDGAFALYEAWVKLQTGEADSALVYAFGKSSMGDLPEVMTIQLDPYCTAPLWPDAISLAALQARAYLEASGKSERDLAEVAVRSRRAAAKNPKAQVRTSADPATLLATPYLGVAAPGARLPADLRRLRGDRPRVRRSREEERHEAGVDPRHRSPHRGACARLA